MTDRENEFTMHITRCDQIKAQVTKFQTYVTGLSNKDNLTQLKLRRKQIEQCWEEFNIIQNGFEAYDNSEEHRQYRDDFENADFSVLAEAEDKLSAKKYGDKQPRAEIEYVSIQANQPSARL